MNTKNHTVLPYLVLFLFHLTTVSINFNSAEHQEYTLPCKRHPHTHQRVRRGQLFVVACSAD